MRRFILRAVIRVSLAAAAGIAPGTLPAQTPAAAAMTPADSARLALARRLLVEMRTGETVVFGMEQALATQRTANPSIPEIFWTTFMARAKDQLGTLLDRLVPIYASRYSAAELQQLIVFYDSPLGRRVADDAGPLSTEVIKAGKLWGMEIGTEVGKELVEKGLMP